MTKTFKLCKYDRLQDNIMSGDEIPTIIFAVWGENKNKLNSRHGIWSSRTCILLRERAGICIPNNKEGTSKCFNVNNNLVKRVVEKGCLSNIDSALRYYGHKSPWRLCRLWCGHSGEAPWEKAPCLLHLLQLGLWLLHPDTQWCRSCPLK